MAGLLKALKVFFCFCFSPLGQILRTFLAQNILGPENQGQRGGFDSGIYPNNLTLNGSMSAAQGHDQTPDSDGDQPIQGEAAGGKKRRDVLAEVEEAERRETEEKKKNREPPIVFRYFYNLLIIN